MRFFAAALAALVLAACSSTPAAIETADKRPREAGASIPEIAAAVEPTLPGAPVESGPIVPASSAEIGARYAAPVPWATAPQALDVLPRPEVSALAAVVIDEASGAVLYEKNGYRPLPPASLTKVATAILAIEKGDLDAVVETDVDSSRMRGSTVMGLMPGDRFTLRDLLYGLLLPSGNDAALAIGRHISGSDQAFAADMNALLYRLGMDSAHFVNPHGLGRPGHVISARDMAMLTRYAMTLPAFREIVAAPAHLASGSRDIWLNSLNSFVFGYPGADSAKVGYTRSAGPSLVASASRYGHRLYVVVLNAEARDADAATLLDWAFANHRWP